MLVNKKHYICGYNIQTLYIKLKINMLQKLIAPLALLNKRVFLTIAMLISCIFVNAQITINTPTLSFNQVCASPTFNTYNLSFSYLPASNLGAGNIFTVELSNASGSFTSPTVLTTSSETTSPINVSFSFPTSVNGTGYRIRIKSSAPVSVSPSSATFSANYAVYNQPFTINNNISNQAICSTSNFSLSIDSGPNSPLNYPQLNYIWYKNSNVIPGQTSSSLPITENGSYFVRVDYGSCSLSPSIQSTSNAVSVTVIASETLTINSQGNATSICPTTGLLLTSTIGSSGYTYQWYRNNILISGATNATYTATQEGNYSLVASNNVCVINSNVLTLTENTFTVSLDSGTEINLIPGQTKVITCTTTASNPTYIWYKNNVVISGQTASSITVTETGTYKVKVKQNSGCVQEKEASTLVTSPSSYNLSIIHSSGYLDCENLSETLTIDSFEASSSLGTVTVPSNIGVTYKWFKNNIEIIGATALTYTISDYSKNDVYHAEATFVSNQTVTSNSLDVRLKINEALTVTNDGILCNTNTDVLLTSSITDAIFTYEWFKEGETAVLGTNTTYQATEVGNYYVTISILGCSLLSNIVAVETIDESILVTNYDEEIYIDEDEEITIIASGADSYEWYINGTLEGISNQLNVNQETDIELIAQVDGCEIVKNFNVMINPLVFSAVIPNTITPNNDGNNDTWIITEEYAYQNDVEIVIFSSNQQVVFRTNDYQNNWPLEPIAKNNKIFFYKILKNNSTLRKGTISVIQ